MALYMVDNSGTQAPLTATNWPSVGCDTLLINDLPSCAVCEACCTGHSKDVFACEKCKSFFQQTVDENLMYTCEMDNKCIINMSLSEKCRSCWLYRCVEVGMKKKEVLDDEPLQKKMRLENVRKDESTVQLKCIGNIDITDGKPKIDSSLSDEEKHLITKLVEIEPDAIPLLEDILPNFKSSEEVDVNVFLDWSYAELRLVIGWSRKVPGFCTLCRQDQISLLKSSFSELSTLRLAYRSIDCVDKLCFTRSFSMTKAECVRAGCEVELLEPILEFIKKLRAIGCDRTEFSIINAVVLTYPDAAGVVDRLAVITLQSRLLKCLQKYSSSRYSVTPCRYGKLLLRLPALRTISAGLAHKFLSMSLEGEVKMNAA